MTLVDVKNVSVKLGGHAALSNVDFSISSGEIVTVIGPNGSGKSTLMRTIIGALRPTTGTVSRIDDLRIGYVPQKLQIDASLPMTVARFMGLPRRRSNDEINAALVAAGAPNLATRQITDLSGGQLQRILLARALIDSPNLLILDEATQGLDQSGSAAFYRQIEAVRQSLGCAVLMVSHDLHVVMATSDRVVCLNGHVCCHGTPDLVASAPEYRELFGAGTQGALALYRHEHTHTHDDTCNHDESLHNV